MIRDKLDFSSLQEIDSILICIPQSIPTKNVIQLKRNCIIIMNTYNKINIEFECVNTIITAG